MQDQLNTVIRQLFGKDSLGDVSEETLKRFTEKYPYSPIGQLLLSKKLRQNKIDGFEQQASKSVLYFNNPLWFDWLLSMQHVKDNEETDDAIKDEPSPIDPLIAETIPEDETVQEDKVEEVPNETPVEEKAEQESYDDELIENIGFNEVKEPQPQEETIYKDEEEIISAQEETYSLEEERKENSDPVLKHEEDEKEAQGFKPNEYDSYDDEVIENAGFAPEPSAEAPIEVAREEGSNEEVNQQEIESNTEQHQSNDLFNSDLSENSGFQTEEEEHPSTETQESVAPASDLIERTLDSEIKEPSKDELAFEPYHTIDYFASQGIKLKQEDLEKDKFGKQLRSFTEWLRSMKKIPGSQTPQGTENEPRDSDSIRRKADESNEGKDIETETMAEVWAKQGNIRKAIDIYNKLSLSNPDKSHYFAAKIEQLKSN